RLQGAAAVIAPGLLPQMEVLAVDGEEPGSVPGAVGDGEGQQAAAGAPEVPRRRQLTVDAHGLVLEDVEIRRGGGTPQVRLVVDLPEDQLGSADLDAVADASRALD